MIENCGINLAFDNESIYKICQKRLQISRPDYAHLNNLIAKVISSTTSSLRFTGELNSDLSDFQTNLGAYTIQYFLLF